MFYIILNIAIKQSKYYMKKVLPPLNKNDTRSFFKKSNSLIRFLNKQILLSTVKGDKTNKERYRERRDSLIRNKRINSYPTGFIESKKKIAVYTVLFGNYDSIKTIKTKNAFCDYYIFTDLPVPKESGWIKIDYNFPSKIKDDPVLKNRFMKMHPHLLFPNYEYSIYLDAVFEIRLDIYRLMARMNKQLLGLFDYHSKQICTYVEAETIIRINKAPKELVIRQMEKYKNEGFPTNFGFCECACIIRKHNNKQCIKVMNDWWEEFTKSGTKRDQLSFMYCVWKNGMNKNDIANLGATFWDEPIIPSEGHKK